MAEQLAFERKANKELASRLHVARREADEAKALLSFKSPSASGAAGEHSSLGLQACGLSPHEVAPLLAVAEALLPGTCVPPADAAFMRDFLAIVGGGGAFETVLQSAASSLPIVDAFAVVGPDPTATVACLAENWVDLRRTPSAPAVGAGSVLAILPPSLLHYTSYDGSTAAAVTAASLQDFACPTGAVLRLMDPVVEIRRALAMGGAPPPSREVAAGADGAGVRAIPTAARQAVYEALLERHGLRRGPRTHTFVLAGALDSNPSSPSPASAALAPGGAAPRPARVSTIDAMDEAQRLAVRSAAKVVCPYAPLLPGRTRYGVCITACDVVTQGALRALAGGGASGGTGQGARAGEQGDSSDDLVVTIPRVFVLISRYPWFFSHLEILKCCVRAWHSTVLNRVGVLYQAGACGWIDRALQPARRGSGEEVVSSSRRPPRPDGHPPHHGRSNSADPVDVSLACGQTVQEGAGAAAQLRRGDMRAVLTPRPPSRPRAESGPTATGVSAEGAGGSALTLPASAPGHVPIIPQEQG